MKIKTLIIIALALTLGAFVQTTSAQTAYTVTSAIWRRLPGNIIAPVPSTLRLRVPFLAIGTTSTSTAPLFVVGTGTSTTPTIVVQNSVGTSTLRLLDNGNLGVGTSTPVTTFHVTATTSNATTTVTIGRAGQTKGTCLELYDKDGAVVYLTASSTATGGFLAGTTSCK